MYGGLICANMRERHLCVAVNLSGRGAVGPLVHPTVLFVRCFAFARPTGGEPHHPGVFPGWGDVRGDRCPALPFSNGGQWDGIHHRHNETHQRQQLGQISHGPPGDSVSLSHLRPGVTPPPPPPALGGTAHLGNIKPPGGPKLPCFCFCFAFLCSAGV